MSPSALPGPISRGALALALTIAAIAPAALAPAQADQVYRSVDAQGNVTYSTVPPPDARPGTVEAIEIQPGPTDSELGAAQERTWQQDAASATGSEDREARKAKRAANVAAAKETLAEAKADLEQARIRTDEDWQQLAGRGRHLKPEYFDRIAAAEARVAAAEQALREAESGR